MKIVIFPEGTYFRGVVGLGKNRFIQMILQFQSQLGGKISFVPVGIQYGERSWGRRSVEIRIGRPLFADEKSEAGYLTDQVMEEIGRLSQLPCVHDSQKPSPQIQ
jgi:1-acyl-sn-glycerol-3-phosphate acyltransferase